MVWAYFGPLPSQTPGKAGFAYDLQLPLSQLFSKAGLTCKLCLLGFLSSFGENGLYWLGLKQVIMQTLLIHHSGET